MKIKKIIAADLCGNGISDKIVIEYKETDGLLACFISAECENGFRGDEAFVLVPDEHPMGEYMAINNHSPFWCRPAFGKDLEALPERTMELLVKTETGYFCCLPVCDDTFKTLIRSGEEGMEFWTYPNLDGINKCDGQLAYVCGEGNDAHELLERVAKAAAKLLGNGLKMRSERVMPEIFKYFGWCSWDALQIRVGHEGLLVKAREFKEKNVPVNFAIIDDMWADVPPLERVPDDMPFGDMVGVMHYSELKKFDGSPRRFPQGMPAAVADLKKYIPHVGIWFPTTGYWRGFNRKGEEFEAHSDDLVYVPAENGNGFRFNVGRKLRECDATVGKWVIKPDEKSADAVFGDFMSRVKEWGCDFVKVDNQGCHTHYKGVAPIGESARAFQKAIDKNSFKYFDGALINCMGMPSECMFNRPDSAISRCSDDFKPESREWFSKNILQCAYNGVLQGQYYINDWDMWWTDDEQAVKNSVCRSISGGPVYVSDKIDRTRPEVLKPVCFDDGRISVCDHSAKPTADCLTCDGTKSDKPLKIFNRIGDTGVVAAYNITASNIPVSGSISAYDARMEDCDIAYFEYFTGSFGVIRKGEKLDVELKDNDTFRLYTLVPIKKGRAVFGRLDKYVSRGAVTAESDAEITLYEGGEIGIYSERPVKLFADGRELSVEWNNGFGKVVCRKEEKILKVE